MAAFNKPAITNCIYLLNFRSLAEKVRFDQQAAEEAFSGFVGGGSQQTNVPDEMDPNLPRIILAGKSRFVSVSQTACQFNISLGFDQSTFEAQFSSIEKNILDFHRCALEFKKVDSFGMSAIVLETNFSSELKISDIQSYLYSTFIRAPVVGDIASTQFSLGYKVDNHFMNIGASVFELRNVDFSLGARPVHPLMLDLDKVPVQQVGLTFKFDINDRPRFSFDPNASSEDPKDILLRLRRFLEGDFEKISGLKVF